MMYTMPKNLLSICVNFALATQRSNFFCFVANAKKTAAAAFSDGAAVFSYPFRRRGFSSSPTDTI